MHYILIADTGNFVRNPLSIAYPGTLVLAQLMKDPEYRAICNFKRMMNHYVILDNGAHEGVKFDINEYVELVKEINPSTVVLMDLVGEPFRDSYEASYECYRKIKENVPEYRGRYMVAPQGTDIEDTIRAFDFYDDFRDGVWSSEEFILGIGCCWEHWCRKEVPEDRDTEDTRIRMIKHIDYHTDLLSWKDIDVHILGARWHAGDAPAFYGNWRNAKWVDTVKPCTCAMNRMIYPHIPAKKRLNLFAKDNLCDSEIWDANIGRFCKLYGAETMTIDLQDVTWTRKLIQELKDWI